MKPPMVQQPAEQLRYARVLEWASRAGLAVLVLSFAAYVSGLMESHVPPQELPQLWVHPVDRFIELTGSPRGWGWIRWLHQGDIAGLLGIAVLAGGSVLCLLSLLPLFLLTHLPPLALPLVLVVSTLFMVLVSGRLIPAMALVTSASAPALRGRFLSMNAALQQLSASAAAFLPSLVLAQGADGRLLHYDRVGYGAMAMTLVALWLAGRVEVRS
jgi:hypothetical protein